MYPYFLIFQIASKDLCTPLNIGERARGAREFFRLFSGKPCTAPLKIFSCFVLVFPGLFSHPNTKCDREPVQCSQSVGGNQEHVCPMCLSRDEGFGWLYVFVAKFPLVCKSNLIVFMNIVNFCKL